MNTGTFTVLVVNPGSTSTKVALYEGETCTLKATVEHDLEQLSRFPHIVDQLDMRLEAIRGWIRSERVDTALLDCVIGRGGILRPIPSGTYAVTERMIQDLRRTDMGEHASDLGGLLASRIASSLGIPAYIADPICVDELVSVARVSGTPLISRRSILHALNQKAVARKAAAVLGRAYPDVDLIVAHIGGGITVGAHRGGRIIDVNNGVDGEGPMTPERSGSLPVQDLVRLCFSGRFAEHEMLRRIAGNGGLAAHLGTTSAKEVEERIAAGDAGAKLVYEAMAYQIAKEIGSMACVLRGRVDAVVLTGGLARSKTLVEWIGERVEFIAPILVFPGENELEALAHAALRALRGDEEVKTYRPGGPA